MDVFQGQSFRAAKKKQSSLPPPGRIYPAPPSSSSAPSALGSCLTTNTLPPTTPATVNPKFTTHSTAQQTTNPTPATLNAPSPNLSPSLPAANATVPTGNMTPFHNTLHPFGPPPLPTPTTPTNNHSTAIPKNSTASTTQTTFTASATPALILVVVGPATTTASPTRTNPAAACPGDATMKNTVGVCGHPVTSRSSCTRTENAALARRRDAPRRRSATSTGEGVRDWFCQSSAGYPQFWGAYRSQATGREEVRDQQPGGDGHGGESQGAVEQRHGTEVTALGGATAGVRVGKEVGEGEEGGGDGEGGAGPEEDIEREGEAGRQGGERGGVGGGGRDEGEERRGEVGQSQEGGAGCRGERGGWGVDEDVPLGAGGGFGLDGDGDEFVHGREAEPEEAGDDEECGEDEEGEGEDEEDGGQGFEKGGMVGVGEQPDKEGEHGRIHGEGEPGAASVGSAGKDGRRTISAQSLG